MNTIDLSSINSIIEKHGKSAASVIPILQAVQKEYRYLPQEALEAICEKTEITPARIAGVSTFYSQFRHEPVGEHLINVCIGTACHVKGAGHVYDAFLRHFGIPEGRDTNDDEKFTIMKVACLGCCSLAVAVQIDDTIFGHVTPDTIPEVVDNFLEMLELRKKRRDKGLPEERMDDTVGEIRVGLGSCCIAKGSGDVFTAFEDALIKTNAPAILKKVSCVGMPHLTPYVQVIPPDAAKQIYTCVRPEDVENIVFKHFRPKGFGNQIRCSASRILDWLSYETPSRPVDEIRVDKDCPQVKDYTERQRYIATEDCGKDDPVDIDQYILSRGFTALKRTLKEMTPEKVINLIEAAGLRGRGGAGFPTSIKWETVQSADNEKKFIVCNGDEGDPGAFMDRMLLESYPYRVIEGIIIAAYTVGATEGYFYVRAEYPLAVKRLIEALDICRDRGYLGENILDSGFNLTFHVMEGAGAFVCGEETALLASIEGRRGMPRLRPPWPARSGLWNRPTLINNVETYSLVPWIIRNGAKAFSALGTADSKGTKVFALAGNVNRGGLIEVPMGLTIREIVEEIGGGIIEDRAFKAVQIGGPSGGCVPASLSDTPVDYKALVDAGAMMGSGGMVVMDETNCMVDIARYFLEFTQDQSCGKCTFCRIGTRRMLDLLEGLCAGNGKEKDLDELTMLAEKIKAGSLCGLGKTAPNPVLSTLKHFRDEYEAHINGQCPAGVCKALIRYTVTDDCIGCTRCAQNCPADAIEMKPYEKHEIDTEFYCSLLRSVIEPIFTTLLVTQTQQPR